LSTGRNTEFAAGRLPPYKTSSGIPALLDDLNTPARPTPATMGMVYHDVYLAAA
jgi:hypothetical protein